MGTADISRISTLVNRCLLSAPMGMSIAECVDEAERKGLDVRGDSSRRILEMGVETVIRLLFRDRCVSPHPAEEMERHSFALWESGWFAKRGDYDCAEYRNFCNIAWTANSKLLPTIGFIDL